MKVLPLSAKVFPRAMISILIILIANKGFCNINSIDKEKQKNSNSESVHFLTFLQNNITNADSMNENNTATVIVNDNKINDQASNTVDRANNSNNINNTDANSYIFNSTNIPSNNTLETSNGKNTSIINSYPESVAKEAKKQKIIHAGEFECNFISSFFRSFSLLLVSETMDKTFIIILYFATRLSPGKLFFYSSVSLIFMNSLSIIIGYSLPFLLYRTLIEWIALISFIFMSFAYVNEAYNLEDETHEKKLNKTVKNEHRSRLLEKKESTKKKKQICIFYKSTL